MTKYKPDKFIVIKKEDADNLPHWAGCNLNSALDELVNKNKYYVCNQDEPYAQKVLDVILEGEKDKC